MAFVKVYNGQHRTDLGLDVSWKTKIYYNVGGKGLATRPQLEKCLNRIGEGVTERVGVLIHPKSVEFCYHDGDHEAEFQARKSCDALLKAVREAWCDSGNCIDPKKVWTVELK